MRVYIIIIIALSTHQPHTNAHRNTSQLHNMNQCFHTNVPFTQYA